ncbi:hypothetical protein B0H12DRAFT_1107625, partial [Mycena haematopus]
MSIHCSLRLLPARLARTSHPASQLDATHRRLPSHDITTPSKPQHPRRAAASSVRARDTTTRHVRCTGARSFVRRPQPNSRAHEPHSLANLDARARSLGARRGVRRHRFARAG